MIEKISGSGLRHPTSEESTTTSKIDRSIRPSIVDLSSRKLFISKPSL